MIKILVMMGMSFLPQAEKDSIGVETVNGKMFVIYKVGEKETLYGISRRYSTTVDAIRSANPGLAESLEIGQVLKVPYTPKTTTKTTVKTGGGIVHVVAAKETVFSIARAYNVTEEEIRQWNNLSANSLSVGQELTIKKRNTAPNTTTQINTVQSAVSRKGTHTVAAKETLYSISRQYNISEQQLKDWNSLTSNDLSIGQVLVVGEPEKAVTTVKQQQEVSVVRENSAVKNETTEQVTQSNPVVTTNTSQVKDPTPTIKITEGTKNSDEIRESGLAELIEGTEGNRKYLALHRSAPVGTILKIRNEMNNREVFVRVMGKLPDNALTDKVMIRISKSAYDRLGAIDPRFRVQITYYK